MKPTKILTINEKIVIDKYQFFPFTFKTHYPEVDLNTASSLSLTSPVIIAATSTTNNPFLVCDYSCNPSLFGTGISILREYAKRIKRINFLWHETRFSNEEISSDVIILSFGSPNIRSLTYDNVRHSIPKDMLSIEPSYESISFSFN